MIDEQETEKGLFDDLVLALVISVFYMVPFLSIYGFIIYIEEGGWGYVLAFIFYFIASIFIYSLFVVPEMEMKEKINRFDARIKNIEARLDVIEKILEEVCHK